MKKVYAISFAILLAGCSTIEHRSEIEKSQATNKDAIEKKLQETKFTDKSLSKPVREIDAVWIGSKTIKVSKYANLPAVFHNRMAFQFPDVPSLPIFADRLGKIINMTVRVSPDALIPIEQTSKKTTTPSGSQPNLVTSGKIADSAPNMNTIGSANTSIATPKYIIDMANPFNGTPADILDKYSAKFNAGWDYQNDNTVLISRYVTRSYQISTILDTNDYNSGISKTSTTGSSSGGSTTTSNATSTSDVSNKITSKTQIDKGLQDAISGILTPEYGKYSILPSGMMIITDTREVHEKIQEIIDAENKTLGKQVRLHLQVIQVEANKSDDMGVDWSWAISNIARKWNVDFSAPAGLPGGSTGYGQLGVIRNGANSTTSAFLNALSTIGKVSIQKDEMYVSLNNRELSVASTDNFIYPAKATAGTTSSTTSSATSGIEPGQLTTGTFLNIRPSIQSNRSVITRISLDTSARGETTNIESNGVKLVYPQYSGNQYQIYSSSPSGDTAVLVGVDNSERRSTDKTLDGSMSPLLGGGVAASTTRRAVLILLTPTVIEGVY